MPKHTDIEPSFCRVSSSDYDAGRCSRFKAARKKRLDRADQLDAANKPDRTQPQPREQTS